MADADAAAVFAVMRDSRSVVPPRLHRPFTARYLCALLSIAGLALGANVTLHRLISAQSSAAAQVNIAGRQRMLTQRIALNATLLAAGNGNPVAERAALRADAALMLGAQRGLLVGDPVENLPGRPSTAIQTLYEGAPDMVASRVTGYATLAAGLADTAVVTPSAGSVLALQAAATGPLVPALNDVVSAYQADAEARNSQLSHDELALLLITLLVLSVEATVVFRPMSRRIATETGRLAEASRRHRAQASRQTFSVQLRDALELATDEASLVGTVDLALTHAGVPGSSELILLTDAHRLDLALTSGTGEARPCAVTDPDGCAALRRGRPVATNDSGSLGACPRLRLDGTGDVSACCVPITFMGRGLGVLKTVGPVGAGLHETERQVLESLASQVGSHLGTLRAFAQSVSVADTDPLTGLLNRRGLERGVTTLTDSGNRFVVVMADLDHFKHVNDEWGHDAGDAVLTLAAKTFEAALRPGDLLARFGGEEFLAVLAVSADLEETSVGTLGASVAERLRHALSRVTAASSGPTVTASLGVSAVSSGDLDIAIKEADRALYAAKAAGRDTVRTAAQLIPEQPTAMADFAAG